MRQRCKRHPFSAGSGSRSRAASGGLGRRAMPRPSETPRPFASCSSRSPGCGPQRRPIAPPRNSTVAPGPSSCSAGATPGTPWPLWSAGRYPHPGRRRPGCSGRRAPPPAPSSNTPSAAPPFAASPAAAPIVPSAPPRTSRGPQHPRRGARCPPRQGAAPVAAPRVHSSAPALGQARAAPVPRASGRRRPGTGWSRSRARTRSPCRGRRRTCLRATGPSPEPLNRAKQQKRSHQLASTPCAAVPPGAPATAAALPSRGSRTAPPRSRARGRDAQRPATKCWCASPFGRPTSSPTHARR
mmetsp:Transcript_5864/g.17039  ORF Transcript_5864/g.17039 Transcript_5864/m.17039 type:complete len:298 (+) Transcript_5864:356-1249(+)